MSRERGARLQAVSSLAAVLLVAAALLLVAVFFGAAGATAGVAATDGSDAGEPATTVDTADATFAQAVDADRTRLRIALQPDGDGHWTVELWTRLEDDADEEAFASLEADVENDSAVFTGDFRERMNGSATAASDATGREMAVENVTVATRTEGVSSRYGVLAYEFEWTNFAAVDGDRLRAGDAIEGYPLEEHTRLTIGWPADYRVSSVDPAPDDRTDAAVVWHGGETSFITGQPQVVVTSASAEGDSLLPVVAIVAVLAVLFVLAWLVHSGRIELPAALGGSEEPMDGDEPADGNEPAAGGTAGPSAGASGTAAATTVNDDGGDENGQPADAGDGSDADDGPPPELLSNEEQVLHLLDEHGGRLKQQQVVAELDWTEAKTSQVVTSMREDDRIEVFRIGRENVLALPGEADL